MTKPDYQEGGAMNQSEVEDGICDPYAQCPNYFEIDIDYRPRFKERNNPVKCARCLEERKAAHFMAMQRRPRL